MSTETVYLQIPQHLYEQDAELNLMAMLSYVIESQCEVLSDDELGRVVDWFCSRYSMKAEALRRE